MTNFRFFLLLYVHVKELQQQLMNSSKIQAHQFIVRIRFKLVQHFRSSSDDKICMIYSYTQNDCNRSVFKENNLKILRLLYFLAIISYIFLKKAMDRKLFFINLFQKRGEGRAPQFMLAPHEKILAFRPWYQNYVLSKKAHFFSLGYESRSISFFLSILRYQQSSYLVFTSSN